MPFCVVCGKPDATHCDKCKIAHYCGRDCQMKDWEEAHRQHCTDVSIYQFAQGSRKDLVWKADDLLGRVTSTLDNAEISIIKNLFERKIAFYDAPMPGVLGARYIRCILTYTGMNPPKHTGITTPKEIADAADENPTLFYWSSPKKKKQNEAGKM